jgi:hypothetical protein
MNPIFKTCLAAILRHALTSLGTILVTRGIWTEQEAVEVLTGLSLLLASVILSLIQKYAAHLLILDALDAPMGTTLKELKDLR